ncbi:MAG TPA: MvaI/BcnI family restriction endonuclease [Candidatus Omnitrophota bacterium]|nr:MvaI/BcnI family restriction endonuclease [Candidatus Omnitrophota bacterium]HQB12202.1 MvaI/BcnI family restriction endonuclease [Candidatus Omnitrophota bacterium]
MVKTYTKEALIHALKEIAQRGWIQNARPGNAGGVGNTLEDLLGIEENNLPVPNAAEWELKCQRIGSGSLTTLFHIEPSPRAIRFVPQIFLLKYGWPHEFAGEDYPKSEMSFRQTIHGLSRSDRGFMVVIDRRARKVLISFDSTKVAERHVAWLQSVKERIGLKELDPQPYWGFDDLFHKAGTKLLNCFYVQARTKREKDKEFFCYEKILMLEKFSLEKFLNQIEAGNVLVDFDARTGHNHGTKFRLRQDKLPELYEKATVIIG